jgi:hypothetical protein
VFFLTGSGLFAIFEWGYYNRTREIRKGHMRSQKSLYLLLIGLSALLSLYFWWNAARIFFYNHTLSEKISAHVGQWEVEEVGSDRYAVAADYTFTVDDRVYRGRTLFAEPTYLNPPSAIAALKEKAARSDWMVWYRKSDPTQSTLEKFFTSGLLFRAIVSSAVCLYFLILCLYRTGLKNRFWVWPKAL